MSDEVEDLLGRAKTKSESRVPESIETMKNESDTSREPRQASRKACAAWIHGQDSGGAGD